MIFAAFFRPHVFKLVHRVALCWLWADQGNFCCLGHQLWSTSESYAQAFNRQPKGSGQVNSARTALQRTYPEIQDGSQSCQIAALTIVTVPYLTCRC
jgi:hypothetical protein